MKRSISKLNTIIILVSLVGCVVADLDDNLIEDNEQVPQVAFTMQRSRYQVKSCKPCGAGECQVMGK